MKTYKLKVPVYLSDEIEDKEKTIKYNGFELNGELLISTLTSKLDKFNESKKITNLYDGFVEKEKRVKLQKNDKVGSENHFVILYPHVFGGIENLSYKWIVLLYEDPNKRNIEIVNATKMVLKNLLDINTKNIKLKDVVNKLKNKKTIPELCLKLSTVEFEENDVDYNFNEFVSKTKISTFKEKTYKNIPFEKVKQILNDTNIFNRFSKRTLKIIDGKQEFKLQQESKETEDIQNKVNELAEESYNFTTEVTSEEIENNEIYKTEFIINKLQPVLENYLGYNHNL